MLVPGCVSMRKVSHLPPASIISELANAAPPLVTLPPFTMMVAPLRTPASSSVMKLIACCPAGQLRAEQRRRQTVQRQPLRAVDHGGRQILVPQRGDPPRELRLSDGAPATMRGGSARPAAQERRGRARAARCRDAPMERARISSRQQVRISPITRRVSIRLGPDEPQRHDRATPRIARSSSVPNAMVVCPGRSEVDPQVELHQPPGRGFPAG